MKSKSRIRIGGSLPTHDASLGDGLSAAGRRGKLKRRRIEEEDRDGKGSREMSSDVEANGGGEDGSDYLDASTTRKVLIQAREQLKETSDDKNEGAKFVQFNLSSDEEEEEAGEEEEEIEDEEQNEEYGDPDNALDEDLEYLDDTNITAEDERALSLFGMGSGPRQTLADVIQAKLLEAEERKIAKEIPVDPLAEKIREVYKGVGEVMKRYTTGKVPKAFKVIPARSNWEELMWMTNPDEWSPASVFVATKLFSSNLDTKLVQIFYQDVLLARARDDIARNKKIHFSVYQSLKRALFKQKAFFKGIIFPLCDDPTCTLREAMIFGSVLAKVSIPMLHSAAALLRLAAMPFSGATSLFIRVLLDKKYALPYRVVDALVEHFARTERDRRNLPVLWHQCLLTFAQRYKVLMTREQKDRLKIVMKVHFHSGITPDIRRELFSVRSRGETHDPDARSIAMEIESAS